MSGRARLQLGFAVQFRSYQLNVLMPDLCGRSHVETICLLSELFLQARKVMGIRDWECTSLVSTAGLGSTEHLATVLWNPLLHSPSEAMPPVGWELSRFTKFSQRSRSSYSQPHFALKESTWFPQSLRLAQGRLSSLIYWARTMAGWHHQLHGHESEQILGDSEGQGGLACCSQWGRKELDTMSDWTTTIIHWYSHGGLVIKNPPVNAGDGGSIPGSGRSLEEGNGNSLQYSCQENAMNSGAWQATVHRVTKELDTT